ncbi:MAG: ATP-dependent DNA helicase RecG [Candidatus Omnitrophica bacterium]|jgi:ATP-dependent DNA helicase RecG|nr:ATP-dependent DNA helicase RecG [Candidatus Omnitrophota bacterium]
MGKLSDISIRYVKGVGPKREKVFNKLGVCSIEDLLYYFPRRYEDRTKFIPISALEEGREQTIKARVLVSADRRSFRRRGFSITEALVEDATGRLSCVWFNQPYLKAYLRPGTEVILYGKIERYSGKLQMNAPEFEVVSGESEGSLNSGRIVPVYSLPQGLGQRSFRKMIRMALDKYLSQVIDFMPFDVKRNHKLLDLAQSILNIHFPENDGLQKDAYARLAFEEFLFFQLPLILRKQKRKEKAGIAHKVEGRLLNDFLAKLPFELTEGQKTVIAEIKADMAKPEAMQRLLQGDVGSGKTVVAAGACMIAIQGGFQAAIMAPTEILSRQHFEKINSQLSGLRSQRNKIKVGLLTSSGLRKQKDKMIRDIKEGKVDLVIGTHALLEENVQFKSLGLAVIDEQHKFGVGQRALLPAKGKNPDILIMTATPIPRTLAITLYGDLDVSVIRHLPPGRGRIKTLYFTREKQAQAYAIAKEQMAAGNQAYIVYPVIEESYALDIAGAEKMYEQFKKGEFRQFRLGLIHGRMKHDEQEAVMLKFKNKELDALVSTTVLEVGIDVPSATCMIVEHAERFGLSQLHQLRGRVGRGAIESFCVLVSGAVTETSRARMLAMASYSDGFRIAEEDLRIRGPGEYFGSRQHGLTGLRIANPLTQLQLLKSAREEAVNIVAQDPGLGSRQNVLLKEKLLQRFPEYEKVMVVG